MIEIIPSISVMSGKCVRVWQGNFNKKVEYGERPLEIATRFEEHGIEKVHLIDLDGAKSGRGENFEALQDIASYTNLEINFGGGVTTDGSLSKALEYGANMVTVGSVAAKKPELVASWLVSYGRDKVCLSADALDRKIKVSGWQETTELDLMEHIAYFYQRSVSYVKCSDVGKDGALEGPNFELYDEIMTKFPGIKLMASGGVGSIDDIKKLNDMGVYGVIFGRAYYENRISLTELERFKGNLSEV